MVGTPCSALEERSIPLPSPNPKRSPRPQDRGVVSQNHPHTARPQSPLDPPTSTRALCLYSLEHPKFHKLELHPPEHKLRPKPLLTNSPTPKAPAPPTSTNSPLKQPRTQAQAPPNNSSHTLSSSSSGHFGILSRVTQPPLISSSLMGSTHQNIASS